MRVVDRILAISDIHGQNTKLLELLRKAEYDASCDLLVICGDMIDRGDENLAVLETCRSLIANGAVVLQGNHEQMAIKSIDDMIAYPSTTEITNTIFYWIHYNGGRNFYHELCRMSTAELLATRQFLAELPQYFTCGKFIFSHAGANPAKPLSENDVDELIWMDNQFPFSPGYKDKIMIFGHVPTFRLTKINNIDQINIWYDPVHHDKIGIDCGSVMGGKLAALELPSLREFYV